MMLTTDGKLVIAKARSQGAIRAKSLSSDIQITGQLWSQASLDLWAGGNIAVMSQASAGALGDVSVNAQGITLNSGAVMGAGLDDQGKFTRLGALNLYAVDVTNAGTLKATGDVNIAVSGDLTNGLAAQAAPATQNIGWLGFYLTPQAPSTAASTAQRGVIEAGRNLTVTAGKDINSTAARSRPARTWHSTQAATSISRPRSKRAHRAPPIWGRMSPRRQCHHQRQGRCHHPGFQRQRGQERTSDRPGPGDAARGRRTETKTQTRQRAATRWASTARPRAAPPYGHRSHAAINAGGWVQIESEDQGYRRQWRRD